MKVVSWPQTLPYHADMHHDIPPPHIPLPDGWSSKRSRRTVNPYCLREIVEDLLSDVPGAFDPERSCPYCVSEVEDAGQVRLLRLDLQRLGHGQGVMLMCPGCGFAEAPPT